MSFNVLFYFRFFGTISYQATKMLFREPGALWRPFCIVELTGEASSPFYKLPDEIILKIFSFLSLESLGNCNQVSHRMKRIAEDTSLWEKVEAEGKVIPAGFVEKIVKCKVKAISFRYCEILATNLNLLQEYNLDLKYMDITNCDGNDNFLSELVKCSKSLEYLNINDSRSNLVFECIEKIAYPNNLRVLCLNEVKLRFESIKKIIDKCTELTDIDISDAGLTQQSITYICTNLTPNALKIDLSCNYVKDEHIQCLVERCRNLKHLDLSATNITYKSVLSIVTVLSHSLVTLALPNSIGIKIGLPSKVCMEKLKAIFYLTMTNLKSMFIDCRDLHLGYLYQIHEDGEIFEILAKLFPKLTILGLSEYRVLNPDPYYHLYRQTFKEVTFFPEY